MFIVNADVPIRPIVMSIISDELQDVKNHCESQVKGSTLITCNKALVQVVIKKTNCKQLTVCCQFPREYPEYPLLIELKSKTLSDKFLSGLTKLCDSECKKLQGRPQILKTLKFLCKFLEENPLCACSEEISRIKNILGENDEIKLKQKTSSISLTVTQGFYRLKVNIFVPDSYPEEQVRVKEKDCNFPLNFQRYLFGQSAEISRQCVEKPLKPKPKDPPFQPKPSLWLVVKFLIDEVKRYPSELCQLCQNKCFPENPEACIHDEADSMHIERVYCGHIFHNGCLDAYLKTPPFNGGKKCPQCKKLIFHDKWKFTPKLAEDRWAHKEAKSRELGEVVEFFE